MSLPAREGTTRARAGDGPGRPTLLLLLVSPTPRPPPRHGRGVVARVEEGPSVRHGVGPRLSGPMDPGEETNRKKRLPLPLRRSQSRKKTFLSKTTRRSVVDRRDHHSQLSPHMTLNPILRRTNEDKVVIMYNPYM